MEAKKGYSAKAKGLPMSPFKIRPVADLVRGKSYVESVAVLEALPNKSAKLLKKVLQSAGANAMFQNSQLDEEMLYIKELLVDAGPSQKRIWARSRGRADRLIKRSSHISIVLDEKKLQGNK